MMMPNCLQKVAVVKWLLSWLAEQRDSNPGLTTNQIYFRLPSRDTTEMFLKRQQRAKNHISPTFSIVLNNLFLPILLICLLRTYFDFIGIKKKYVSVKNKDISGNLKLSGEMDNWRNMVLCSKLSEQPNPTYIR